MGSFSIWHVIILIAFPVIYFLPWLIAWRRKHLNVVPFFLVNLLAGWLGVFWVVALVWSFTSNTKDNRDRMLMGSPQHGKKGNGGES